jgi:hypothetical protein
MSNKSSTNSSKHPYQKLATWEDKPFWREHPQLYTPAAIEYYENWLAKMRESENRPFILDKAA